MYLGGANQGTANSSFALSTSNSSSLSDSLVKSPQETDRFVFLENFLNECSNQHSRQVLIASATATAAGGGGKLRKQGLHRPPLMRSTSYSPSRQAADDAASRCGSQSPSRQDINVATASATQRQLQQPLCQSVQYGSTTPIRRSTTAGNGRLAAMSSGRPQRKRPSYCSPYMQTRPRGAATGSTAAAPPTRLGQKARTCQESSQSQR